MDLKEADAKTRGEEGGGDSIRGRILSAAFAAFTEHGFTQASTLEIATRAKVSKRELYALFGNKQQMLVACIQARAKRMRLPVDWPVPDSRAELEAGLAKFGSVGLLPRTEPARMSGHFMSLLLGDVVMGLALGLTKRPGAAEIRRRATEAVDAFQRLYPEDGATPEDAPHAQRPRKTG